MGRECEPSTVFRAQELYCVDRLPMERVRDALAAELGDAAPAMSTLWRWSDKYGWPARREEIAQALADIAADTVLARAAMLKKLLLSKDPMVGFAVEKLENLAIKQAEAARSGRALQAQMDAAAQRREIRTPEDMAAALEEAVDLRLKMLLADPGKTDLKAVMDIKDAMEMVAGMRPREKASRTGGGDEARKLINELLGYK